MELFVCKLVWSDFSLLSSAYTEPRLLLLPIPTLSNWGCTGIWEVVCPGQLTPNDHRSIPYHTASSLVVKLGGRLVGELLLRDWVGVSVLVRSDCFQLHLFCFLGFVSFCCSHFIIICCFYFLSVYPSSSLWVCIEWAGVVKPRHSYTWWLHFLLYWKHLFICSGFSQRRLFLFILFFPFFPFLVSFVAWRLFS